MVEAIWTDRYKVCSFMVDSEKRLTLAYLLSLMQESAWVHAAHLGQGHRETSARGVAWVIVRQRVEMDRWPAWEQELTVRTWLRPPSPAMVVRDFEFFVSGEKLGQAAAHWITIDEGHRRPVRLGFPDDPTLFRQQGALSLEPAKLSAPTHLVKHAELKVQASDLDLHGHVNNTRFADWILNGLPLATLRRYQLLEYEVNFLAEVTPSDSVTLLGPQLPTLRPGDEAYFQGRRRSDDRVCFVARLQGRPSPQLHSTRGGS